MALNFEYGINVNNRFLDLTGHDEDPDEFIATQSKVEEKPKEKTSDAKSAKGGSNKKSTTTTTTSSAPASSNNKTTKEGAPARGNRDEHRKPSKVSFSEGGNQEPRADSARGPRGSGRRGGNAGGERPGSEGGYRGGSGYSRPPRTNRSDGQRQQGETGGFDQSSDNVAEGTQEGGYSGRGRGGRGRGPRGSGTYEVRRGGGRPRGPRGGSRGGFSGSRADGDNQFQTGNFEQETGNFEHDDFEVTRPRSGRQSNQGGFESGQGGNSSGDNQITSPNSGRGGYRGRTFRSNRGHAVTKGHDSNYEEGSQDDYRRHRRQHDRERRNEVSGVKAVEKKDGDGANNWGNRLENPEETTVPEEVEETTETAPASGSKQWADVVDEAEKQMTLDEYRKQLEAKKKTAQEKLPVFNPRTAGEGEDPKAWKKFEQVYRKKNDEDESDEENQSDHQESEGDDEQEEESSSKRKFVTIPLTFKDESAVRGGPRRGSGRGRPRENRREFHDESNDQPAASSEQTGDQNNEGRAQSANFSSGRGSRPNYPRTEFRRRPYNQARGGQSRSGGSQSAHLNLNNHEEFPSLAKQS